MNIKENMQKAGNLLFQGVLSAKSAVEIIDQQSKDIDKITGMFILPEENKTERTKL